jgi:hypothetical protein
MIEVFLFALGVGIGYGLSTLSIYMGNKMANNMVHNFTAPIQTEDEPALSSEVNPIYDFQSYEDTMNDYIGTIVDEQVNDEPDDEDFKELNGTDAKKYT